MLLLALAALIPPPPGWTPPVARGPGIFCGRTFRLDLPATEQIAMMWPGEVFINDVYGTYYVTTAQGDVVVTEDGARTRPSGRSRNFTVGSTRFRGFANRVYSVAVHGHDLVHAVTVRFPEAMGQAGTRGFLARLRLGIPAATSCLRPAGS